MLGNHGFGNIFSGVITRKTLSQQNHCQLAADEVRFKGWRIKCNNCWAGEILPLEVILTDLHKIACLEAELVYWYVGVLVTCTTSTLMYIFILVFVLVVTSCLVVAVQPCMECMSFFKYQLSIGKDWWIIG